MNVGCSIGIIDDNRVEGRWALLPRIGIDHIEPGIGPVGENRAYIASLAETIRGVGLRVRTVHANFGAERSISSPDAGHRAAGIKAAGEAIDACVVFGGNIVVVHCGDKIVPGQPAADAKRLALESLKPIVDGAQAAGVKIALENLPKGYVTSTAAGLMEIVTAFPADLVGVCADTGHAQTTGEGAGVIGVTAERLITVHLHDNDGSGDQHLIPGEGAVDWETTGEALGRAGYGEVLMFEVSGPGSLEEAIARIPAAAEMIRRYATATH